MDRGVSWWWRTFSLPQAGSGSGRCAGGGLPWSPGPEYEDRQYATTVEQPFFLLEESTTRPAGAWVDTRLGPVELTVITAGGYQPPLSEDVLRMAGPLAGPASR